LKGEVEAAKGQTPLTPKKKREKKKEKKKLPMALCGLTHCWRWGRQA